MKRIILLGLILLCIDINGQSLVWGKRLGGNGTTYSKAVDTDSIGNVYVGGSFSGIVDFDPGSASFNASQVSAYVAKLDKDGQIIWARTFGDPSPSHFNSSVVCNAIKTDKNGDVYATGAFIGAVDFDPGSGTYIMTSYDSIHSPDIFIVKYTATGNFVWAKKIGGQDQDIGIALTIDNSNNVIVAGTNLKIQDFDPGPATYTLTPGVFILKLNTAGNFVWAKSLYNVNLDEVSNFIQTDAAGNIYYSGSFSFTLDFDPGPGVYNLTPSGTKSFILKLNSSGNFVWARCTEGSSSADAHTRSMALDQLGNIYIAGDFFGTVDFDPGTGVANLMSTSGPMVNSDVFVLKLDNQGNFLWAKSFGGPKDDWGHNVATDFSNDVYLTGVYQGTVDFDPASGVTSCTSQGSWDTYVSKFANNGNFLGVKVFGNSKLDLNTSMSVSKDRDILLTGIFGDVLDVDPDASVFNLSPGAQTLNHDVYVVKFDHGALSLDENALKPYMRVYPNPSSSFVIVEMDEDSALELIDVTGKVFVDIDMKKGKIYKMPVDDLSPGIYFLKGHTTKGMINQKIVITD